MLELAAIFTTSGVLLFYKTFNNLKFDIIHYLITEFIVKEKKDYSISKLPYHINWKNFSQQEHSLIFVIAYQETFNIEYPNFIIEGMIQLYSQKYLSNPELLKFQNGIYLQIPSFDSSFQTIFNEWQKHVKQQKEQKVQKTFYETQEGKEALVSTQRKNQKSIDQAKAQQEKLQQQQQKQYQQQDGSDSSSQEQQEQEEEKSTNNKTNNTTEENKINEDEIRKNREKLFAIKNSSNKKKINEKSIISQQQYSPPSKKPKEMATSLNQKVTKEVMDKLDKSQKQSEADIILKEKEIYLGGENDKIEGFLDSDQESDQEEENEDQIILKNSQNVQQNQQKPKNSLGQSKPKVGFFAKITNSVKTITGNKVYDDADLEPVLKMIKEQLMSKNVAEEVAQKLYESVRNNLINTKSQAFQSLKKLVKESLKTALTKILTPTRHIDIIAEAEKCKQQSKPYVVVFIGVNGVGKSTNLAKIAYLFKNQNYKVMLAACDNFRAGAVEQLKTHGRCLDIPVFDNGYKNDPADIAFNAIKQATISKTNVVLIDTAGRMQDNEPLMKSLARLVILNNPNLIIFIGEALVGNDGLDQLTKFNKSLIDLSERDNIREIDGVILSKFDTVDDKVGSAINMTYTTGKPILFCGVGQKYTHLKKLNVNTVVHALLS